MSKELQKVIRLYSDGSYEEIDYQTKEERYPMVQREGTSSKISIICQVYTIVRQNYMKWKDMQIIDAIKRVARERNISVSTVSDKLTRQCGLNMNEYSNLVYCSIVEKDITYKQILRKSVSKQSKGIADLQLIEETITE